VYSRLVLRERAYLLLFAVFGTGYKNGAKFFKYLEWALPQNSGFPFLGASGTHQKQIF
jgi:hypothetical protein